MRVVGILSLMLIAFGCGAGHDCKAYNNAVCDRAKACGYTGCNFDICPGNDQVDFSQCIDGVKTAACDTLQFTATNACVVVR